MAFGLGEVILGAVATALTVSVLFGLDVVENQIQVWRTTAKFEIEMIPSPDLNRAIKRRVRELGLYQRSWQLNKTADGFVGILEVTGPESNLDELQKTLMHEDGVKALVRL
jgi:hypothetical protein